MLQSSINESQTPTTSSSSSIISNENLFASSASNTAISSSSSSSAKTISSIASMMTSAPSIASSIQAAAGSSSNDIKSNESQTFGTFTPTTNSNAVANSSISALLNKFSNEQIQSNTNYNAELFDPALLLAELGVGTVEELAQSEFLKSLIQSMMTNREEEFASNTPTNLIQDNSQINNDILNALIAQSSGVKSSSQSQNTRLSNADFVASAF